MHFLKKREGERRPGGQEDLCRQGHPEIESGSLRETKKWRNGKEENIVSRL